MPGPFLIQNITHQIPFENFELGRKLAYFYDTVRILVLKEGEFIAAHVLDGSPFEVMVTADQKNLQVFCTCRAFQDTFLTFQILILCPCQMPEKNRTGGRFMAKTHEKENRCAR